MAAVAFEVVMTHFECRRVFMLGCALPACLALTACGGGGGGVSSTPVPMASTPVPPPPPPPPPSPPPSTNFNTAEYRQSNGAVQANALSAYSAGATGAGVVAAVIDTGITPSNAEFLAKIHPASADVAGTRGIVDEDDHGTAVASVLLGAKNDSGTHGVAFGATLLVARADTPGTCADPDPAKDCTFADNAIARGVDLAVANGARVINISLGGSPANLTLSNAIDRATAAGTIIVISAGNEFDTDPTNAINPDPLALIANESVSRGLVLIAGAVDSANVITNFSNRAGTGANHYLVALGRRVLAIDKTGVIFQWSGTSFSAPIVAGAVALLAQAFPNLTSAQIVDLLLRTAVDLGDVGTDAIYGHGALDLARAFAPQGTMSLAGSAVPFSLTSNSILSTPMGDAAQNGLGAVVLDAYGRAYSVDLGQTIGSSAPLARLAPALRISARSKSRGNGNALVSLSITEHGPDSATEQLLLSPQDVRQGRAIAGALFARLDKATSVGLGIRQGSMGLAKSLSGHRDGAFLVGEDAGQNWGFRTRPTTAFALRHLVGSTAVTLSAEHGRSDSLFGERPLPGQDPILGRSYGAVRLGLDRQLGPLALSGGLSAVDESQTLLGAHLAGFAGQAGAQTYFADAAAALNLGRAWSVSGTYRRGWTRIAAGGVRERSDHLASAAWSVDLAKTGLLSPDDTFALRIAQPLRISHGGLNLLLPTSYDYATRGVTYSPRFFSLAPTGREIDVEALWSARLGRGWMATNLFWRKDPGNIAAARNEKGLALRYNLGF
jgi:Subtilase family